MKIVSTLVLVSLLFSHGQVGAEPSPQAELEVKPRISIDFQDADLEDVLKVFSQQSGLNFVASEKVKDRKVTLYLDKVTVQDALNNIMDANDLTYERVKDSDIFIVKELVKPEVETITKVLPLKYTTVSIEEKGLMRAVRELLTPSGRIGFDRRTNSLIITDIPINLPSIEQTIKALDVQVPQVMIEVEVLETSLATLEAIGLEWGSSSGQLFSVGLAKSDFMFPYHRVYESKLGWRGGSTGVTKGTLGTGDISAVLELLTKDTETKVLATPKVLTLSNREATILVGEKFPVVETTVSEETGKIMGASLGEYYDIGVQLSVTPQVCEDNYINMIIHPAVTSYTETVKTRTEAGVTLVEYPIITTKEAETQVLVKDGETIVIGGLIETKDTEILRKVPFLGDIPILGLLFRKKDVERKDTELLIFITPHIVGRETLSAAAISTDEPGLTPIQPEGQEVLNSEKKSAIQRAIREATSKVSSMEPF